MAKELDRDVRDRLRGGVPAGVREQIDEHQVVIPTNTGNAAKCFMVVDGAASTWLSMARPSACSSSP